MVTIYGFPMEQAHESAWDARGNNFDFMRLALAVLVVYSHAYLMLQGTEIREPAMLLSRQQVTLGGIAVDAFFIMSGFLITASALRSRGAWDYLGKRVMRIYPAFVVASLFGFFVVAPLAAMKFTYPNPLARLADLVQSDLTLRSFNYTSAFATNPNPDMINGSLWSISYEFWCYLGVLALALTAMLKRPIYVVALFVAAWLISIPAAIYAWADWPFGRALLWPLVGSPSGWARMLPLYLAGVVFYLYRRQIPRSGWAAVASTLLLIAACWIPQGFTLLFPFAGTYLVFWLAFAPRTGLHQFGRFGDFSYGTYLYAYPIEQLLVRYVHRAMSVWLLFAYATVLTLACAVASWYGVERRFLRPARRKEKIVHPAETAVAG